MNRFYTGTENLLLKDNVRVLVWFPDEQRSQNKSMAAQNGGFEYVNDIRESSGTE